MQRRDIPIATSYIFRQNLSPDFHVSVIPNILFKSACTLLYDTLVAVYFRLKGLLVLNKHYCNTNLYVSTTVFITQGNM